MAEHLLGGGVVRTAFLRAHEARQTMLLADADPLRPPVVAATIGMDDWFLAVPERGARVGEHAVGQCRVGAGADRPGDRKPIVAVDHGRQVGLARGTRQIHGTSAASLRSVRNPAQGNGTGAERSGQGRKRYPNRITRIPSFRLRVGFSDGLPYLTFRFGRSSEAEQASNLYTQIGLSHRAVRY